MIRALLLSFLILFQACAPTQSKQLERLVAKVVPAVVRLHIPGRSCTAFHIGNDIFLTAAHCVNKQPVLFLEAQDGVEYVAIPLVVDYKRDLASVRSLDRFNGPALSVWSVSDGNINKGMGIVAFGFPGYYFLKLTFEVGYVKDLVVRDGEKYVVSSDLGFQGESGGPIVSLDNGKVIGINSAMIEQITLLDKDTHLHNTVNLIIGAPEIAALIIETYTKINAGG